MTQDKIREALIDLCDAWDKPRGDGFIGGGKYRGNITEATKAARSALSEPQAQVTVWADLGWEGAFSVLDPAPENDHSDIYLVCPNGLMINTSCDPTPGLDAKRTQWMADTLNNHAGDATDMVKEPVAWPEPTPEMLVELDKVADRTHQPHRRAIDG